MVMNMRPPPEPMRKSRPAARCSASRASRGSTQVRAERSGTSRPSVSTCTRRRWTPSLAALAIRASRWSTWLCTLPSDSRPSRCRPGRFTASRHAWPSKMRPEAMAAPTSLAPWSKTRPPPRALWPTSLLPMSPQSGRPTAGPWACSSRQGWASIRRSRVGVRAVKTASPWSRRPQPTPSMMQSTVGPVNAARAGERGSARSAVMEPPDGRGSPRVTGSRAGGSCRLDPSVGGPARTVSFPTVTLNVSAASEGVIQVRSTRFPGADQGPAW